MLTSESHQENHARVAIYRLAGKQTPVEKVKERVSSIPQENLLEISSMYSFWESNLTDLWDPVAMNAFQQ